LFGLLSFLEKTSHQEISDFKITVTEMLLPHSSAKYESFLSLELKLSEPYSSAESDRKDIFRLINLLATSLKEVKGRSMVNCYYRSIFSVFFSLLDIHRCLIKLLPASEIEKLQTFVDSSSFVIRLCSHVTENKIDIYEIVRCALQNASNAVLPNEGTRTAFISSSSSIFCNFSLLISQIKLFSMQCSSIIWTHFWLNHCTN
jgi:hypothetical protein